MYCEKCGKLISDEANFCKYCGAKVASFPIENRLEDSYDPESYYETTNETNYNEDPQLDSSMKYERKPLHNKTKNIIVWTVLICLLVCAAFYNNSSSSSDEVEDKYITEREVLEESFIPNLQTTTQIDHQTNSMNGGNAVTFNDYTYYINVDGNIYRMSNESQIAEAVIYGTCSYLCYYGDNLYFADENYYVHEFNTLTKEDEIIISTGSYYLSVTGTKLFYQNDPDGESIFSFDLETRTNQQYNDEHSYNIMYRDDLIYYSTKKGIYQLDMDSDTTTLLVDENVYSFNIIDSMIYYLASDQHIYAYNMDDESTTEIVDITCYEMVCNDQYLCFLAYNNDNYEIGYIWLDDLTYYDMLDVYGDNLALNGQYLMYTSYSTYILDLSSLTTMELDESYEGQSV